MKATFRLPENKINATFKIQKVVPADDYIRKDEFDNILNVDQIINEIRQDVVDIADVVEDLQLHKAEQDEIKNGQLFINVNDEEIGSFHANEEQDQRINIDIPTHVSELINDLGLMTRVEVEHLISQIQQFEHKVVEELPQVGSSSVMYLVPKEDAPNVYEEFIWLDNLKKYEDIGSTAVDLSEYAKKTDIPTDYATTTQIVTLSTQTARYDLSNVTPSYDYVISEQVYGGGESGKRKWKNGRFEQWGVATTSDSGEVEFTVHEAFRDMLFSIFVEPREKGNFFHYAYPSAVRKFKTRITDITGTPRAIKVQWKAEGYWK